MRKISKLLLIALLASYTLNLWAQASTEGKEFWVALLMANSPDGFSENTFEPFIAISAKKQCKVTISNPSQGWTQPTRTVNADDWIVIKDIPLDKWYDKNWTASNASEKITQFGIKVDATEDVSVYAAIRMEYSYDASNVLPITALQNDYMIQDYPPYNSQGESHAAFVIVATEDNTTVAITPTSATQGGKAAGTKFTVNLQKGETYQVIGLDKQSFSGTRITAYDKNDHSAPKPIAVFQGADFTQVPGGKSARDCLYEQAMPLDYWGTEFVVSRSVEKDANRIRITASDNMTDVSIDGYSVVQLQPGETWEFEMSEDLASTAMASAISGAGRKIPMILKDGEAHYIQTSCPVAVYSYDVSSDYRFSTTEKLGDPSMVWISPLQQRISKITFGACGTSGSTGHTNKHYVNIVCLTSDVASVKLSSELRSNIPLTFQTVPGNPQYSYARVFLVDTDGSTVDKVYTLESSNGVVAHVYGSGNNESYAYSVGSAAVKQGINVNGKTFTDGYRSDEKFCLGSEIAFDAKVGTDEITRVDWDFGDGTTQYNSDPITTHTYHTPGWYDVTAKLYGRQACTDESEQEMGSVSFTFRIWRHDTVLVQPTKICLNASQQADTIREKGQAYLDYLIANPQKTILNPDAPCEEDRQLSVVTYGLETEREDKAEGRDSVWVYDRWYYPEKNPRLPDDGIIKWVEEKANEYNCDIYVTCQAKIITCLDIDIPDNPSSQHICLGDQSMQISYIKKKGDIDGDAIFTINELPSFSQTITIPEYNIPGTIDLPLGEIKKPGYYTGKIVVNDLNCPDQVNEFPLNIMVFYPSDIFKYKFHNVLTVYNPGFGGNTGYEFTAYQWYRNGVAVPGATEPTYYLGQGNMFNEGDEVWVELTDKNGMTLKSCPQTITNVDDYLPEDSNKAPRKVLQDQRIRILRDGRVYDMYGQKVK